MDSDGADRRASGGRNAPSDSVPTSRGSHSDGSVPLCDGGATRSRTDRTGSSPTGRLYDGWARLYDLVARHSPGVGRLRRRAVDALELERGDAVVDLGCGTGANLPLLARAVGPTGRVLGVDAAPGSVALARRYARTYPQVDVVQADAVSPPVGADVDAVLATFLVGMLDEPGAAVDAWCDLVAGEGDRRDGRDAGHVALLHLRRSEHLAGPVANATLELVTRCSAPPLSKVRYEESLAPELDRRVREAHDALRARADATVTESHCLDLVELAGGRFE